MDSVPSPCFRKTGLLEQPLTGQVDHDIRSVDFSRPSADRLGIPADHPPRSLLRIATEHHHVVAASNEGTGEQRTDLPGSSWDNNLHVPSLRPENYLESLR